MFGLRRLLILSIWNDPWSLGEGSGVPDEIHFVRRFREAGVELHFLIPEPSNEYDGRDVPGVFFHTYGNIFRRASILPAFLRRLVVPYLFTPAVLGDVQSAVDSVAPDLMLGFSHYSIEPLSRISRRMGIPAAVKLFGVMFLARRDLTRIRRWWLNFDQERALRHPLDGYIVLDDGTMGDVALLERGIDPAKIHFLPNGMDLGWADARVDTAAARSELGLPQGMTLIATVSRLVKLKRVDLLIDAFSSMDPAAREGAALVIVGDGPERSNLEDMARAPAIAGKVFFTGAIPYDSMPRLLKCCDIFAATSELTNSSMPPCEAMLCGLPVVAFDVAGTSNSVRHGETGLLAGNGDIEGIATALERLVTDPEMRERLGRKAAKHASEHFLSWEERTGMELHILEELVSRG